MTCTSIEQAETTESGFLALAFLWTGVVALVRRRVSEHGPEEVVLQSEPRREPRLPLRRANAVSVLRACVVGCLRCSPPPRPSPPSFSSRP